MSIRAKILVGIAASLVLIVCVWPGLSRCYYYHKVIAGSIDRVSNSTDGKVWEISALNTISHKPVKIELHSSYSQNNFSIGYAEFYLDQNDVCEIRIVNEQILLIKCDTYNIGILPPTEPISLVPDSNNHLMSKMESLPNDFYQAQIKAAYVGPKTYFQIFCMSREEFSEYMELCLLKMMISTNENRIGIFEIDRIKGLIGFDDVRFPNKMVIDLYSADSNISQEIIVNSDSSEKSREIVSTLLSSYKYLIEKPLNDFDLQKVIFDKIGTHPLFRKDNPEEYQ